MNTSKMLIAAVAISAMAAMSPATAATVTGIAVANGTNATTQVGITRAPTQGPDGGNQLGATAIEYYIPLGNGSGTYGVSNFGFFGLFPDSGNGGGTLSMFLLFNGVSGNSMLNIKFQDLDLNGANDPTGFLESLQIFKGDGTDLTGLITDIGGLVTGTADSQTLSLALSAVNNPLYLKLNFKASSTFNGTNTAEYLVATVSTVPLPSALLLFGSGLAGIAALGRRRKRSQAIAA